jgi:hypothetical protein
MFDNERIKFLQDSDKSTRLKDRIVEILKEENISISEARGLFIYIIGILEDTPIGADVL